jgi:hypothetical protein
MKNHLFFASVFAITSLSVSVTSAKPPPTAKQTGRTPAGRHHPFMMHGQASIAADTGDSNTQGIGDVRVRLVGDLGEECQTKVQIKKLVPFSTYSVLKLVTTTGALFLDRDPGSYRLRFTTENSACTPPDKLDITVIADREIRVNVKYVSDKKKGS